MAFKTEFEAFFFPTALGNRFAIFYSPKDSYKGAFLFVHPFAEEMNKSRRMAALQARAFAEMGYATLIVDLYGCGDSAGNLHDADWTLWKEDLTASVNWLSKRVSCPLHLWGLRLGANLGLDFWQDQPERFASALLWQPVLNGDSFFTQFLRLAVAGEALRDTKDGLTTGKLRQQLTEGNLIEVAGYGLSSKLMHSIDAQKLSTLILQNKMINWLDIKNTSSTNISPATQNVLDTWRSKKMVVNHELVTGDQFWATQEIVEVPSLITTSCKYYSDVRP